MRQWEIWKCRDLPGFDRDHWFVILSGQERIDNPRFLKINGLACFTLRGSPKQTDVLLNGADGFEGPTACQCDFAFILEKAKLHSRIGQIGVERQRIIKAKLKEVLRLY